MLVVDASVLLEVLRRTPLGDRLAGRLLAAPGALHAPHLIDLEVTQVLRRLVRAGTMSPARGAATLRLLAAFPLRRHPHQPLLDRIWTLAARVTAYDGAYLALAEVLHATVLTLDARLARSGGSSAIVEVVP